MKLQQQCQRSDSDNRVSIDAKCVNAEDGGTGDRVKVDKTVKANDRVKADDTVNAKHMVNTEEYAHFVAIQK